MRVLFIYPNLNAEEGFNHGVADLSGALKARGHVTGLLNINEALYAIPSDERIVERVRAWRPDFVAFSVMTQQYGYALRLARAIKAALPAVPIAIGGVHALMCTEEVKNDAFWDFIGIGECDEALPELSGRLEAARRNGAGHGDDDPAGGASQAYHAPPSAFDVRNFCIRRPDGTYQQNPLGPYPDLNALPPKDYECYDLAHMLRRKNGWQSILTSRGCPYRCSYCFNHEVTDRYLEDGGQPRRRYLRRYEAARIIREIKELKGRHPYIETIIFDDDLFTLNRQHVIDFCKAYVEEEVGIPFVVNAHVQAFSEPVARALSEAPCMIVKFGVESGSDELRRKVLDRTMSNQAIVDAFDLCHQYGLHTSAFLMFGLPYETRAMMEETIDLMARIKPGRMRWAIFFPFPGTKSYTICQLGDLIDRARMAAMDNYFCASCLKFDGPTDLFIRKLQRVFHWHVNARAGLPTSATYAKLVDEVERMSARQWHEASEAILQQDRQISNDLLAEVNADPGIFASSAPLREAGRDPASIRHYSIRYTEVMAVSSDFILAEKGHYKDLAARRWKAFRETIDESRAAAAAAVSPPPDKGGTGGVEVADGLPELRIVEGRAPQPSTGGGD